MRFALSAAVVLVSAAVASAGTSFSLGFSNVTANSVTNAASGETQLAVQVLDAGSGLADFRFTNTGADAMSIADIYFNNSPAVFLDLVSIDDSHSGVSFSEGAAPPNPPGLSFGTAFKLDSDAGPGGVQGNGVNPGEWLTVRMSLLGGVTFADLTDAFGNGLAIAIHVQGFANGGSETFQTTPYDPNPGPMVPLPAGGALAFVGLGLIGATRRRTLD